MTRTKAETKKKYIRIGALVVACVMVLTVVLAVIIGNN